jgi:hypothetical protein
MNAILVVLLFRKIDLKSYYFWFETRWGFLWIIMKFESLTLIFSIKKILLFFVSFWKFNNSYKNKTKIFKTHKLLLPPNKIQIKYPYQFIGQQNNTWQNTEENINKKKFQKYYIRASPYLECVSPLTINLLNNLNFVPCANVLRIWVTFNLLAMKIRR